jgi:glycerol kinase
VISGAKDLDEVAATDSAGVLCVPALAGLAAPWWRSDATATLSGMTLSTGREHVVRAVLEGIAAQVAELVTAVARDTGTPLTRLRVDGGLTQSRVLMQATASILQIPIDVYPSPHATALGAAALAELSLDPRRGIENVSPPWQPSSTYEPQWNPDRATEFRAAWRTLATATLPPRETP